MDLQFNHTDNEVVESWFADIAEGEEVKPALAPTSKTSYQKNKNIVNPDEKDILRFRLEAQKKRKALQEDIARSVGKKIDDSSDEENGGRLAALMNGVKRRRVDTTPNAKPDLKPVEKKKKQKK